MRNWRLPFSPCPCPGPRPLPLAGQAGPLNFPLKQMRRAHTSPCFPLSHGGSCQDQLLTGGERESRSTQQRSSVFDRPFGTKSLTSDSVPHLSAGMCWVPAASTVINDRGCLEAVLRFPNLRPFQELHFLKVLGKNNNKKRSLGIRFLKASQIQNK